MLYRYLAVDAGMRYGPCVRLDGSVAYTIYALAVVATTERDILDIYTEVNITKMTKDKFVTYARSVEEAMFEKHADRVETCIVDGVMYPPSCRRIIQLSKSPITGAIVTPYGFVRGAMAEEVKNIIALNNLAHRYANEYAAMLWRELQRRHACVVPYGSHPALEYSLFTP